MRRMAMMGISQSKLKVLESLQAEEPLKVLVALWLRWMSVRDVETGEKDVDQGQG